MVVLGILHPPVDTPCNIPSADRRDDCFATEPGGTMAFTVSWTLGARKGGTQEASNRVHNYRCKQRYED